MSTRQKLLHTILLLTIVIAILDLKAATVTIDTSQTYQTIEAIGGNFARGRKTGSDVVFDIPAEYCLRNLDVQHARVGIPLKGWEKSNDNDDPFHFEWTGFNTDEEIINIFKRIKALQDRNIPVQVAIWDVADWMVIPATQDSSSKRVISQEKYDEFIESMAAFLIYGRDHYDIENIDYLSINEANGGYSLLFSAEEYAKLVKMSGPRLKEYGVAHKWLVGDVSQINRESVTYIENILADEKARPYLGPVSGHSWWALADWWTQSSYEDLAALARKYDRSVWVAEVGYNPHYWLIDPSSWQHAWKTALTYYKILKYAQCTVADYWEYMYDYSLVDSASHMPWPDFFIIKMLSDNLNPGTQQIQADSDNSQILAMAFLHPETSHYFVQTINTTVQTENVTITGLPDLEFTLYRSTEHEYAAKIKMFKTENGILEISVPANSVNSLVAKPPADK
jgi:hypothetical protein